MTADPHTERLHRLPAAAAAAAAAPQPTALCSGAPAGHLVCDLHGRVCWSDDIGAAVLHGAEVLLLQADGRLGVRSHWLGLLALRTAMRQACLGAAPVPVVLRHGHLEVQVTVHALDGGPSGRSSAAPHVLLSLRRQLPAPPCPPHLASPNRE